MTTKPNSAQLHALSAIEKIRDAWARQHAKEYGTDPKHGTPSKWVNTVALREVGVRITTLRALERMGLAFERYVHYCPAPYREWALADDAAEALGIHRSPDNPDLWVKELDNGHRITAYIVGSGQYNRWLGNIYYEGDQSTTKADTIGELIANLIEITTYNSGNQ